MDSTGPRSIIDGFDEDFIQLVERFKAKSADLGVTDFLDIWDEQAVDYIFANRYDPRELLDAITEMNKRLVLILAGLKTQNPHQRIVAIYFSLCLFVKQPPRMKQKIRITCDDAISIEKFCSETCGLHLGKDVWFAWTYLLGNEAIDIVEQRIIYGPSMLSSKGTKKDHLNDASITERILEDRQESLNFIDNKIEPHIAELENMTVNYKFIRDVLELDRVPDTSSSNRNLFEIMKAVRGTVNDYKYNISNF